MTSESVDSFTFAIWAFHSDCFPIDLVPCADGWQRTWWQTTNMIPQLPVSSIPQCKQNHHSGACVELYLAVGRFEPIFIEAHQASKKGWKVTSIKSQIMSLSFWEEIITLSKEGLKNCDSDMAVRSRSLVNPTQKTAESTIIV
jgi:hypothetical protein